MQRIKLQGIKLQGKRGSRPRRAAPSAFPGGVYIAEEAGVRAPKNEEVVILAAFVYNTGISVTDFDKFFTGEDKHMIKVQEFRGHIRNWEELCERLGISLDLSREEREEEILVRAYETWGYEMADHRREAALRYDDPPDHGAAGIREGAQ